MRRSDVTMWRCLALAAAVFFPSTAVAGTPTHVACVGDSITYGYAASSPSASYPSDLQKMFGASVNVMNFGHSGATMLSVGDLPYQNQSEYTAATSFVAGAGASAVVSVVVMLGTNDTKSQNWMAGTGTRTAQFQTDAAAMVDHFAQLATHPTVYLALPTHIFANSYGIDESIMHDQIEPIIRDVADSKGIALIDLDTPTAGHPELFSDGVHPTDAGYALVAMIVHDALVGGGSGGAGGGGGSGIAGRGGGGAGGVLGAGGGAVGGTSGASGGAIGSGGTVGGGTDGGSGGAEHGGTATGGAGTGGLATGTGGRGTGGTSTGGVVAAGTGGAGTGGAHGTSSGGAFASSTGTGGGATSIGTGGTKAGGGETSGAGSGCACATGDDGAFAAGPIIVCGGAIGALLGRRKRRFGPRQRH